MRAISKIWGNFSSVNYPVIFSSVCLPRLYFYWGRCHKIPIKNENGKLPEKTKYYLKN